MFDVIELPRDWPVDLNFLEAQAFCKWKGQDYRLPTEAEINIIRGHMVSVCQRHRPATNEKSPG